MASMVFNSIVFMLGVKRDGGLGSKRSWGNAWILGGLGQRMCGTVVLDWWEAHMGRVDREAR
jgi:hypothetical protein